ncbi:sensor histidine kinase N-terminal domain-containing protein [Roseivivax marinus]|uniref:sensor histidine kinase N-terminal domain-containing protein n=1 Tax=Roseivivax marinus TaxID=1379903 RepID=UPI001F0339CE|nr:sensor histidine kinase N-terminal domain-containing protein [Roseivivax marinus]UMA66576.1 sensor histidine kinase N-terminal domain-containing protein [Roseivivax marinus]
MAEASAVPRRRRSITTRLALTLAAIFVGGGTAIAIAALAYGRTAADRSFDRLLIGAAEQIAEAVAVRGGRLIVDIPASAFELLSLAADDRIVYAVTAPDGALVTGYPDLPRAETQGIYDGEITGADARFVRIDRLLAERALTGRVTVVVGQTTQARTELAREIAGRAVLLSGIAGLFMAGLALVAVRRALAPLDRLARHLSTREAHDLRPVPVEVPREIGVLVDTLDRFMARVERQVSATQALLGDAPHQLRTPIAAIRAHAELAREERDPEKLRAMVTRIHQRALNLGRLADQMLSRAMIIHRADAVPRAPVDLREVAMRAVDEVDHLGGGAGVGLHLPEDAVRVAGDALSLGEAVKNLLANALRYGTAPVAVSASGAEGRARIEVLDAGPGIPEGQWVDAMSRFAGRSGVSAESAGLGLSIVASVAEAHEGTLRFSHNGVRFHATLEMPMLGAGA